MSESCAIRCFSRQVRLSFPISSNPLLFACEVCRLLKAQRAPKLMGVIENGLLRNFDGLVLRGGQSFGGEGMDRLRDLRKKKGNV